MGGAMAISLDSVRRLLASDEPDYAAAARLGPQVLPYLLQLVAGSDEGMASKAVSLTGTSEHAAAVRVLGRAAQSRSSVVRVAAAGAARRLRHPAVSEVILKLLGDADKGVRKFAIKAAARRQSPVLLARVRHL